MSIQFDPSTYAAALQPRDRRPGLYPFRKDAVVAPWAWHGIGNGAVYLFRKNAKDAHRGADGTNQGANLTAVGKAGQGAEFITSDRIECPDSVGDAIATSGTIAFAWTHDGVSNVDGSFFDDRAGLNDGYDINININGANSLNLLVDTGSLVTVSVDISGLSAGLVGAVARYDGANAFLDVTEAGSASAAQTGTASRSATTKIGNIIADSIPLGAARILHFMFVSERVWTDAEVKAFIHDPFSVIRPDIRRMAWPKAPAAAGISPAVALYHARHHNRAA